MQIVLFFIAIFTNTQLFAAYNYRQVCLTHGECQKNGTTKLGQKCVIVKTGVEPNGRVTCTLKCLMLPLGSYCKKIQGMQIGFCQKERYEIPDFDWSNPDCKNAMDPF